jgi:hypothetical protein
MIIIDELKQELPEIEAMIKETEDALRPDERSAYDDTRCFAESGN